MSSLNKLFSLTGKTAIVTGGCGLLGKEHCNVLAEAGANVVVLDVQEDQAKEVAQELSAQYGVESVGLSVDITSSSSLLNACEFVKKRFQSVDILVNNAAINDMVENPVSQLEESKFENYSVELFRKVLDVNVTGMFLVSQIFGKVMTEQRSGTIINIASTYGIVAPDQRLYTDEQGLQKFYKSPVYPVSKGAVIMFTKFLAAYWGNVGVRVNTLSPGGVENGQDDFFKEKYSTKTMLGRMATKDDYKGALLFLASEASSYVTGSNIIVDGGWTAM